jgi:hypothetical protein
MNISKNIEGRVFWENVEFATALKAHAGEKDGYVHSYCQGCKNSDGTIDPGWRIMQFNGKVEIFKNTTLDESLPSRLRLVDRVVTKEEDELIDRYRNNK